MGWEPASNKQHQELAIDCKVKNCPVKINAKAIQKTIDNHK